MAAIQSWKSLKLEGSEIILPSRGTFNYIWEYNFDTLQVTLNYAKVALKTLRLLLLAGTNFSVLVVCCIWQVLILAVFLLFFLKISYVKKIEWRTNFSGYLGT